MSLINRIHLRFNYIAALYEKKKTKTKDKRKHIIIVIRQIIYQCFKIIATLNFIKILFNQSK